MLCAFLAGSNVAAGVLVTLVILLGAGAAVWYYRQKKGEGESKAEEDGGTESSKSSESSQDSEWSEDTDTPSTPAGKTPNPTKTDILYENIPNIPPYENIPNPSYTWSQPSSQDPPPIPSPPHIWSPPS
ncbi:uncharacterized protein LOC129338251 [Eublepharis macularius]|uniref:Uncharacterized protein LOC129338251 n=1 Tax=Eublepharis macularius TaxID=481883 RepID=A0AA97L9R9_EUBMA|nr:uncharacterized protein LOC129338251 [Eublepharis macularius]